MSKLLSKKPTAWLAATVVLSMSGCSDLGDIGPEIDNGESAVVAFKIAGTPQQNSSADDTETLSQVNVFHFSGDTYQMRTDVADPYSEHIGLTTSGTTRIYCVSGAEVTATDGMKEANFTTSTVTHPQGAKSAPLFYSAVLDLNEESMRGGKLEVTLSRGVARLDFVNDPSSHVEVTELIVEDAPASTYVFANGNTPDDATVKYSHEFAEPFYGTESAVFTLFESSKPVHVRILGTYGDSPLNICTTIPTVERNKAYTLKMVNVNSYVVGALTIQDWTEGGSVGANPSTGFDIFIDKTNSVVPEGVTVNYAMNTVTVPASGVTGMKLAFVSDAKINLESVEGDASGATITAKAPVTYGKGFLSAFDIDIQPNSRLPYSLFIHLKDDNGKYNFIDIKVESNPNRTIETVEMAGSTWMAFNATSPNLDDQIYPVDGASVEDMYRNSWVSSLGGLFQFGRQYMYIPYQGYNPCNDLGGQKQDIPWVNYSHMPCPEGYHVATLQEWRTLCPNNTPIPGTYTTDNGETIRVELVRLPGDVVTPTKVNGVCRYLKFISEDTGNVLILPLGGFKGDKSTAASANFGRDVVYWTNSNVSCPGGYARAYRFMFNWGDSCQMQEFQFQMEAFAYVRCIKNNE